MAGKKLITIIGATGRQGGSVADIFLKDPVLRQNWTVRAVTRDVSKEPAQKLKERGAEVVTGNLDNKSSLEKAFTGADAVFGVTNYWETSDMDAEIQQGKNIVDAAMQVGVSHLIWSSLINVKELTNGKLSHVHHFDSKAAVESYARSTGISATYFLAGVYMDALNIMIRRNSPDSPYVLALPIPEDTPIPFFDVSDTGIYVKAIVLRRDHLLGKRINASPKYLTPKNVIDEFKKLFPEPGETASYMTLPNDVFLKAMTDAGRTEIGALEMLENILLWNEGGYFGGEPLDESLRILQDKPTSVEEFLKKSPAFQDLK